MNVRRDKRTQLALTTAGQIVKDVTLSSAALVEGFFAKQGKEMARNIVDQTLKDQVKGQFAYTSSTLNAFLLALAAADLFAQLGIMDKWKDLSGKEKLAVSLLTIVAIGGSVYPLFLKFGVEENVLAAGIATAASILFFSAASNTTNVCATKRRHEEEFGPISPSTYGTYTP